MQLTLYTDYALRVLLYLTETGRKATVKEIADFHRISRNHLSKVVHELGRLGYLEAQKGRDGGILLKQDPSKIPVSKVVRDVEPHFNLVECFQPKTSRCPLTGRCRLNAALARAQAAFMDTLSKQTIADLAARDP